MFLSLIVLSLRANQSPRNDGSFGNVGCNGRADYTSETMQLEAGMNNNVPSGDVISQGQVLSF